MPRKLIKKWLPDTDKIKGHKSLRLLVPLLGDSRLWHMHRRNVARAVAIGFFFGFMPIPIQMLLAAICAIIFRANLPISVVTVWVSNPLTIPPMFYFAYKVGTWIIGAPLHKLQFTMSWDWLMHEVVVIWKPLFLGSLICGAILSVVGFVLTRLLWRVWVMYHASKRRAR